MIIDSHSHYDDEAFDNDREEIIEGLTENGVEAVVSIGCDIKTTLKAFREVSFYLFYGRFSSRIFRKC